MAEPKKRRWPWVIGGLVVLGALLDKPKEPNDTPSIPRTVAAPPKKPNCGDMGVEYRNLDIVVCGVDSTRQAPVPTRDEVGAATGTMPAGTRVFQVKHDTIKRGPGHVDQLVCFYEGPREGELAWVQNTHIAVAPCN